MEPRRLRADAVRRRRADAGLLRRARDAACAHDAGAADAGRAERARRPDRRPEERFPAHASISISLGEAICRSSPRCRRRTAGAQARHWLREEQGYRGPADDCVSAPICATPGSPSKSRRRSRSAGSRPATSPPIAAAFHAEHEKLYESRRSAAPRCRSSMRCVVIAAGVTPKPEFPRAGAREHQARPSDDRHRRCVARWRLAGSYLCWRRTALLAGQRFAGPAIVAQNGHHHLRPAGFPAASTATAISATSAGVTP